MTVSYANSVAPTLTIAGTRSTGQPFSYRFVIGVDDIQKTKSNEQAYLIRDGRTRVLQGLAFGQNAFNLVLYGTCEFALTNDVLNDLRQFQSNQFNALLNKELPTYINAPNLHGYALVNGILSRIDPGESFISNGVTYYDFLRVAVVSNNATWS